MNELADRMEELVERLREGQIDIESRQRLLVASQKLAVALETPLQACRRVAFLVCTMSKLVDQRVSC
jgi:hypothetical protein